MFDTFVANLIYIIHFAVLGFVVLAPFSSNQKILTIEMALLLTIMFHWITNNQVCCLTEFEKILRDETDDGNTFFGRIMGPVYSFGKDSQVTQILLFILIMVTLYRVKPLEGLEIKKLKDLFINKWMKK